MKTTKILFLAANPVDTRRLMLDEELRRMKEQASTNNVLELVEVLAARPDDWLRALNAQHFRMVHFSGHGTQGGALQHVGSDGIAQSVSFQALKATLRVLKGDICLIVFNACYSRKQAAMIAEDIDCVIVMNDTIHDDVAITFINAFYRALFGGKSVQNAFEQGKAALMLEGLPEVQIPELLVRPGIDASKVVLIESEQRNKAAILFNSDPESKRALKELRTHLDFYKQKGMIDYWDHTQLMPGSKKDQETRKALVSARVAILLINQDFLASPSIMQEQLPILLQAAEKGETELLCVLLSPCTLEDDILNQFTLVSSERLSGMSPGKRKEIWNKVAILVRDSFQENV
ncbi:MAG TPA: CHAT domain-containing protein [Ktedonobacteraceae bacterium]|nr:CHAT domain-containing protein [Ktedonobacteraceae bacterium]